VLFRSFTDPLAGQARVGAQQALDLVAKGIELRGPRRPPIAGRLTGAKRAPDRLPIAAGAALDLLDREPLGEVHAADLRPLLHSDQLLLLALAAGPRLRAPANGASRRRQGGVSFQRRRVRSIQAAPTR